MIWFFVGVYMGGCVVFADIALECDMDWQTKLAATLTWPLMFFV